MTIRDNLTADGYEIISINMRVHSIRSSTGFWVIIYESDHILISLGADKSFEILCGDDLYDKIIAIIGPP